VTQLSKQLSEHLVAAELSRRGIVEIYEIVKISEK
jgi:hypothetical protein